MKKISLLLLFVSFISFSFQKTTNTSQPDQKNLKHLQVKITGMTCEIGCARTIESKISKMEGVFYAHVNFSEAIGEFSYDPKVTSETKIINKINGIGGGELYKVIEKKEVEGFYN